MLEILNAGMKMGEGTLRNSFECPYCGHPESTLLSNDGEKIVFTCFRVKCPEQGTKIIDTELKGSDKKAMPQVARTNPFTFDIYPLNEDAIAAWVDKYHFSPVLGDVGLDKFNDYVIPLYDINRQVWGHGVKTFTPVLQQPKFTLWRESPLAPALYFPPVQPKTYRDADTIIVVEDAISALRLSQFRPTVSILGTNLRAEEAKFLSQHFDKLILWLDADTWDVPPDANHWWKPKPIELKNKYYMLFDSILCQRTDRDPKDLEPEDLDKALEEL